MKGRVTRACLKLVNTMQAWGRGPDFSGVEGPAFSVSGPEKENVARFHDCTQESRSLFSRVYTTLKVTMSVGRSVSWSIRQTDRQKDRQMNGNRVGCAQLGRN